jgi:hypothetical protein
VSPNGRCDKAAQMMEDAMQALRVSASCPQKVKATSPYTAIISANNKGAIGYSKDYTPARNFARSRSSAQSDAVTSI